MIQNLKWLALLFLVVALFFWKILFTGQFSILTGWEESNQPYAWSSYAARSLQRGILPVWDPYALSGRSFVGETQTGLFDPLKLLLFLSPLTDQGILSERIFHQSYIFAHLLGACFMFLFAKELGVKSNVAAFIAAICFALGGFVGNVAWTHHLDSAIWLPLILWGLLRALRAETSLKRFFHASFSGLCLGMSILAGSIHVPMMNVFVIVSAAFFFALQRFDVAHNTGEKTERLLRAGAIVLVIAVVSFAIASPQLLPSMEYAQLARRWTGDWSAPFHVRIPYGIAGEEYRLAPRSLFAFVFGAARLGSSEFSPYLGVLPFILAAVGVWRNWDRPWVKYLAVLGIVAFFCGMGSYSFLHGLLYLLVPYFDKFWEAGRLVYLTNFAMAVLAGFGAQSLFAENGRSLDSFSRLTTVLRWAVIAAFIALGVPVLLGNQQVDDWHYMTLFFLIASWAAVLYAVRKSATRAARFLVIAVILCDLHVFNWTVRNKMYEEKSAPNHLAELLSARDLADFFHAQQGPFRVHLDMPQQQGPWGMGDLYGVETTLGTGVSMMTDYLDLLWSPRGLCLFNVGYVVAAEAQRSEPAVFRSGRWSVYEVSPRCPRAWVVHQIERASSDEEVLRRVREGDFDPLQVAIVNEPLQKVLQVPAQSSEEVTFLRYQEDGFDLNVNVAATGLLVLSEIFYPGWEATVNGELARIYMVNGALRGIIVSPGRSRITMLYRPASVRTGFILFALALSGTLILAVLVMRGSGGDP